MNKGVLLFVLTLAEVLGVIIQDDISEEAEDQEPPSNMLSAVLLEPPDTCPDLREEFETKKGVLKNLEDGMLGDLCGGDLHCTKVVITSNGGAAIMQGPRLGVYFLYGWNQHSAGAKYPSFYRPVSKQFLFFMHELNGDEGPGPDGAWEYWHTYSRWVIGPTHNKALGGIMIKPYDPNVACPWQLKWFRSQRWYHDVNHPNLWNPKGNPWIRDDSIFVHCYEEEEWPQFTCGCQRINISSSDRVQEYHPDRLGEYVLLEDMSKEGYLAPVYASVGEKPSYLYSHHPRGKVWTIGSSQNTWSLRLNKLSSSSGPTCPLDTPIDKEKGWEWEYLQSKKGEKEVWLRDLDLKVECIDPLK